VINAEFVRTYSEPDAEPIPLDDGLTWFENQVCGEPDLEPGMDSRPWVYRIADDVFCFSYLPFNDVIPLMIQESEAGFIQHGTVRPEGWTPPGGSWVRFNSALTFCFNDTFWSRIKGFKENKSFRTIPSDWVYGPCYESVFGPLSQAARARVLAMTPGALQSYDPSFMRRT